MASDSSSSSSADEDASDRVRYLQAKIAKLEKKKQKMKKREKKHKKKSKKDKHSDSSDNDDEKPTSAHPASTPGAAGREAWMTAGRDADSFMFPSVSLAEVKAERKKEREARLYEKDPAYRSRVEARKLIENVSLPCPGRESDLISVRRSYLYTYSILFLFFLFSLSSSFLIDDPSH
jgi:hypothetical protein